MLSRIFEVLSTYTTQEARQLFAQHKDDFVAILMDYRLETETSRQLSLEFRQKFTGPIIMLSGDPNSRHISDEHGYTYALDKPFSKEELLDLLASTTSDV